MASFPNLTTAEGLQALDKYLATRSYISGYVASRDDLLVYSSLSAAPDAKQYPNNARWFKHINALLGVSFPGSGQGVKIEGQASPIASAGPIAPKEKEIVQPIVHVEETTIVTPAVDKKELEEEDEDIGKDVMDDDDDDDLDLFGEMTEEEKKAAEEKKALIEAKKKKAAEKSKLSKSMIILDVKPWDDTTDLAELEKFVRSIQHDGLLWGQSKLVPVGFGIRKLQITAVIEDAKVESMDGIIEDEIVQDGENPHIQSVDIVAFNKL